MEKLFQNIIDQGVLGSLVIILILMFRSMISKLMTVIENNTIAMTKVIEATKKCRFKNDPD